MASMSTTATPLPGGDQEPIPAGSQHSSGSIGPFFAVISVIIVLTVLSCIFGRVYAAQVAAGPDAWYDCLGWARRRCRRYPFRKDVVREAKAAVAAELEQNPKESKQLSLPLPQP